MTTAFALSALLTAVLSIGFGGFVFAKGPRRKVNLLWAMCCLMIAVWATGIALEVTAAHFENALFWARFSHFGAILIPAIFVHFVVSVLNRKRFLLVPMGYAVAFILEGLNLSGILLTVHPVPPFNFFAAAPPIYYTFFVYFAVYAVCAQAASRVVWKI